MTSRKRKQKHRRDGGPWMARALSAVMAPARKRKRKSKPGPSR